MLDKFASPRNFLSSTDQALQEILRACDLYIRTFCFLLLKPKILHRAITSLDLSEKNSVEIFPPIAYFFVSNTVFIILVKFLGVEKDKELFNQVYQKLTISSTQFAKEIHTGIPFYLSAVVLAFVVLSLHTFINSFFHRLIDKHINTNIF